jgi:deazaflavin-dependent oxidoreductase (nitroreductase family)
MAKAAPQPFTPTQERIAKPLIALMSKINTAIYRWSGGRLGGKWIYGAPIMLLTTRGRKSGQPRTAPLLYLRDGDRLVTVASQGGMSKDPQWFLNLEADPNVEVEIGKAKRRMVARRATPDEKVAYWSSLTRMYPDYDDYQARTERDIPVVILSPTDS